MGLKAHSLHLENSFKSTKNEKVHIALCSFGFVFFSLDQLCLWALSAKLLASLILKTDNNKEAFNCFYINLLQLIFI